MIRVSQLLSSQHFAATCANHVSSLFLPTWYEYLSCTGSGAPQLTNINDVWLIVAAVIQILLRVAAVIALGIIIYAGVQYSTSSGNPETTSKALNTIISAAVGLLICVASAVLVNFIARSF